MYIYIYVCICVCVCIIHAYVICVYVCICAHDLLAFAHAGIMLDKFTLKIHTPYWLFKIACESINILILKTCQGGAFTKYYLYRISNNFYLKETA